MKTILIKVSGELFSYQREGDKKSPSFTHAETITSVAHQIKKISRDYRIGIVVGGGNFFRGALNNGYLELNKSSAHHIGMLATMVNGIMLRDLLVKNDVKTQLLSALPCPAIAGAVTQEAIDQAFAQKACIIFVGGTGNPFFTTDTTAIVRGLQIGANEIWKATKVDGVYSADPVTNKEAKRFVTISYREVLATDLDVMDHAAIAMAQEHGVAVRVFNLFTPDALLNALEKPDFGSTIR